MTRWNLTVPEETDRSVRRLIGRNASNEALSKFVDQAVRQSIFYSVLQNVRQRNEGLSEENATRLAEQAVTESRENRS